jgi:hypothetical protein
MPDLIVGKPIGDECPAADRVYVDLVGGDDLLGALAAQIGETLAVMGRISEADSLEPLAAGKWCPREIAGHMIDTERIFAYRALCFARGDRSALAGFEQDDYVRAACSSRRPWWDLREELSLVRKGNLLMFRDFSAEEWQRTGSASGNPMSARAAAYIVAGHEIHHVSGFRRQFGLEGPQRLIF